VVDCNNEVGDAMNRKFVKIVIDEVIGRGVDEATIDRFDSGS
jgi:hypothetical protein